MLPLDVEGAEGDHHCMAAAGFGWLVVLNEYFWNWWRNTPGDTLHVKVDGKSVGSAISGTYLEPDDAFRECRVVAELPAGRHTVRTRIRWYRSYPIEVEIKEGEATWLRADVWPLSAPGGIRTRLFQPGHAIALVHWTPDPGSA